ncbi:MAG TPA: hypothetical protein VEK08_08390 [Planctomycetota bacterium]|nr:hypothetical protein [Planctomycetota bacterium]
MASIRVQPRWVIYCVGAAVLSLHALAFDASTAVPPIKLDDIKDFAPLKLADLPNFMQEVETRPSKNGMVHTNGLLSTINYCEFKKREPYVKEEIVNLDTDLTGFNKRIEVRCHFQNSKAPLAVVLLGFGQASTDKLARAWQTYLHDAGCHVATFDSLIRNNMNEATGHGVAGNFAEEAQVVGKIVDALLKANQKSGTQIGSLVSSVRLLGTSYGGLLTLQILRLPQAKSWPIDRALVCSTPVNMGTAARRLDTFSREDKPFFGIMSLMKLMSGYTPKGEQPTPKEEALMRAGIGYCFHGDLQSLAKSNIDRYDPELTSRLKAWEERPDQRSMHEDMLKSLKERHVKELRDLDATRSTYSKDEFEQLKKEMEARHKVQMIVAKRQPSEISEWNFQDYMFLLLKPYWKLKRADAISVTLADMMAGAPNFVQVVITADDPLNDTKEYSETIAKLPPDRVLALPHGGHLGYAGTKWMETVVGKFFKSDDVAKGK